MERLANLNDATITDIEAARQATSNAAAVLEPVRDFLDLLALQRAGLIEQDVTRDFKDATKYRQQADALSWSINLESLISQLHSLRFLLDQTQGSVACSAILPGRKQQ